MLSLVFRSNTCCTPPVVLNHHELCPSFSVILLSKCYLLSCNLPDSAQGPELRSICSNVFFVAVVCRHSQTLIWCFRSKEVYREVVCWQKSASPISFSCGMGTREERWHGHDGTWKERSLPHVSKHRAMTRRLNQSPAELPSEYYLSRPTFSAAPFRPVSPFFYPYSDIHCGYTARARH